MGRFDSSQLQTYITGTDQSGTDSKVWERGEIQLPLQARPILQAFYHIIYFFTYSKTSMDSSTIFQAPPQAAYFL